MRHVLLLLPLLAISACKQETGAPIARAAASAAAPAPKPAPIVAASASAARAREVSEQNDLYSFDYAYPGEAGAIPGLKAWLDSRIEKERAELVAEAKKGRAEAKQNGFPYNAYYRATGWQVVTELPGWLSLSAGIETYEGGAHPNHWPGTLLWDKAAGQRHAPLDLFISKQALTRAIRSTFCAEIDRQREEKRGEKVDRASGEMFTECIDLAGQTVILGSSNHRTFDRIGILVAPYEAGPYAEGDYEVTLPVTQAVMAAVKPEFRSVFSPKR
jgi:Deacetylase PdaC